MAQITRTSGSTKKAKIAKIAKIIHKKKREAKILLILLSKNKPRMMRKVMISPL